MCLSNQDHLEIHHLSMHKHRANQHTSEPTRTISNPAKQGRTFQEPRIVPDKSRPEPNPNPRQNTTPFRNPTISQAPPLPTLLLTLENHLCYCKCYYKCSCSGNTSISTKKDTFPYPQPLIVPGDQIRGDDGHCSKYSSVGGGMHMLIHLLVMT